MAGLDPLSLWKEDSSGSEELDPPEGRHYPMDLKLAEARCVFVLILLFYIESFVLFTYFCLGLS